VGLLEAEDRNTDKEMSPQVEVLSPASYRLLKHIGVADLFDNARVKTFKEI